MTKEMKIPGRVGELMRGEGQYDEDTLYFEELTGDFEQYVRSVKKMKTNSLKKINMLEASVEDGEDVDFKAIIRERLMVKQCDEILEEAEAFRMEFFEDKVEEA